MGCLHCHTPLAANSRGRPRQFCDPRCRGRYYWAHLPERKRRRYQTRTRLRERYRPCVACGHRPSHSHHIVPRAIGGSDATGNLVRLCANCHEQMHILYRDHHERFRETCRAFAAGAIAAGASQPGLAQCCTSVGPGL
jgi:5-methylcytosine-specific restriction endonuclease McrA